MTTKTKKYTHKLLYENGTELEVVASKDFQEAIEVAGVLPAVGDWVLWERSPRPITKRFYYVSGINGYKSPWYQDKGGKLPKRLAAARKTVVEKPVEVEDLSASPLTEEEHIDQIQLTVSDSGTLTRYKVRNSLFRLRDNRVEPEDTYLVSMIWDIISKQLRQGQNIQGFTHEWDVNPDTPLVVLQKIQWTGVKAARHDEILAKEIALQMRLMQERYGDKEIPESAKIEAEGRAKRSTERKLMDDKVNRIFTGQD